MSKIPIFKGTTGLNTVIDPLRLPYDRETGIMALSAAVNVVVDDSGMASRRDGFELALAGSWHSLFCDGGDCLGVRNSALCVIAEDLSYVELRSGLDRRVSYAQVNQDIYYTSPPGFGLVRAGQHVDWAAEPYVGPDTDRQFSGPFEAEHIAFYAGRIWLARDGFMVHSEPFAWSWFDFHKNLIPMDSRVRMMKPVTEGMYVSTETTTYFLSGKQPEQFELKLADTQPALEFSVTTETLDGMEVGLERPGIVAFWLTSKGPVMGTSEGNVIRLSKDKIVYPKTAPVGASLLRGYNLVHTMGV